jgi:hypothetical protein
MRSGDAAREFDDLGMDGVGHGGVIRES